MAEIRVEPKRRSMAWLWILLLLLIAAGVAWYFMYYNQPVATPTPAATPTTGMRTVPATLAPVRLS